MTTTPTPVELDQIRADHHLITHGAEDVVTAADVDRYHAAVRRRDTAVPAMCAEIAELRAALALASGGDTAKATVRRLLAKASDHGRRADTAEARVATLEHVAQGNKNAYVDAVKDTRRAERERDEARARVDELETAHAAVTHVIDDPILQDRDPERHGERVLAADIRRALNGAPVHDPNSRRCTCDGQQCGWCCACLTAPASTQEPQQ